MEKRKQEDECKTGVLVKTGDYIVNENCKSTHNEEQLVTRDCTNASIAKCKTSEEEITVSRETKWEENTKAAWFRVWLL